MVNTADVLATMSKNGNEWQKNKQVPIPLLGTFPILKQEKKFDNWILEIIPFSHSNTVVRPPGGKTLCRSLVTCKGFFCPATPAVI